LKSKDADPGFLDSIHAHPFLAGGGQRGMHLALRWLYASRAAYNDDGISHQNLYNN